jgi:hypothetical protein
MEKICIATTVTVVAIAIALLCLLPALAQGEQPDLIITEIVAYHYDESCSPWFNLVNEVDVTIKNDGAEDAEAFYVSLSARVKDEGEYEIVDKQEVPRLGTGSSAEVHFEWTPIGDDCLEDCTFIDTSKEYELKAVADCDNNVNESENENGETNNEKKEEATACYNGYTGDEPLENAAHGTLHGGLIFTTGDGEYGGLYSLGDSIDTSYEITIPAGASVVLARLNVYYTWHYEEDSCPAMEVSIGGTVVELDVSYNDIKCQCPGAAWVFPWGNYVYNITDYIQGSDTYTVTVTRKVFPPNPKFCIAAPGIVLVYADTNAPVIEYWINEGADILIGGRRGDGGYLSLEECKNTATFPEPEERVDLEVEKATLGVVSAWGEDEKNVLYFNDEELGEGVYCGYHDPCTKEEGGISMSVGIEGATCEAQVGIAVFDVTDELKDEDNVVIQGDDGDCMMPVNAFLVITYEEEEGAEEQNPPNVTPQEPVDTEINNIEGESRTFSVSIDQSVDIVWQLNGTEVQTDEDVTEASYTNASAVLGTWNVSAIGTSRETGLSGMHTWIWNVTAAVGTTPTSAVNITSTPTPTLTATPASSVSATPTPTPTPTTATPRPGEKKKAEAEETKAPGFELAMSSFILIAVAYIRIRYRNKDKGKKKGAVLK